MGTTTPIPTPFRRGRSGLGLLLRALAATLVVGVGLAGCQGFMDAFSDSAGEALPDADEYVAGRPIPIPDADALWERSKQTVLGANYSIDDDLTVYSRREIVSRWAPVLHWRRYEGYRTRVAVRLVPYEEGHWQVRVAVQRQVNSDMDDPMNPLSAIWEDRDPDVAMAEVLLWKIESGFRTDFGE